MQFPTLLSELLPLHGFGEAGYAGFVRVIEQKIARSLMIPKRFH